jgi:hypothetical protein
MSNHVTTDQTAPAEAASSDKAYKLIPADVKPMIRSDERLLFVVRRHPIGIIYIYLEILAAVLVIFLIGYFAAPTLFETLSSGTYRLVLGAAIIAIALLVFILLIATYVYRLSMLVVTNKSLLQVTQSGLFARKVARFTMSDVEDVTAEQRGILATIFIYGTLTVQTAGTQDNFNFTYCPDPNRYAHLILEASAAFDHKDND